MKKRILIKPFVHLIFLIIIVLSLSSCVTPPKGENADPSTALEEDATDSDENSDSNSNNNSSGSTPIPSPPSIPAGNLVSGTPLTTAEQDRAYTFTPTNLNPAVVLSFTSYNLPTWATLNPSTGAITGIPTNNQTYSNIVIDITGNNQQQRIGPFSIAVSGDPLVTSAWHLRNTGQRSYAAGPGVSGEDIGVRDVYLSGTVGTGVSVLVSDSGVELTHEDLAANSNLADSKNYNISPPYLGDPTPGSGVSDGHGTSVAGIIGAVAGNGLGSRGVAPAVDIAGNNLLSAAIITPMIISDAATGPFDIINQSFGTIENYYIPLDPTLKSVLEAGVSTQRGGLGIIYVKSAGNDFSDYRNANADSINTHPSQIVVGAINASGVKSSYSSSGSNIWTSAPGGEYGYNAPAIITTDLSGCTRGLSGTEFINTAFQYNAFEMGHAANPNCNYTSIMNGTSSAAPVLSGVIALMLEANPGLTWRDVKHILAQTADLVDASIPDYALISDPPGHINEPTWMTNAAGFRFHNWYGFGRVNAPAAVNMARTYVSNWGPQLDSIDDATQVWNHDSGNLTLAVPDFSATGVSHTINVTDNYTIEAIQIRVSVIHPFPGNIGIELTSPSMTKSVLFNTGNSFSNVSANLNDFLLLSNAFYGETSLGNWTIKIVDGLSGNTGSLTNWKINIIGR